MKIKPKLILAVFLASMSGFFACNPDDTTVDPVDPIDKFIGGWSCTETSQMWGTQTYSVRIDKDPSNSAQVLIVNFYHFGFDERAYAIATSSKLTIPQQIICNTTCWGSGTISGSDKINWNYYINDGADIDTVTAVYNKQ